MVMLLPILRRSCLVTLDARARPLFASRWNSSLADLSEDEVEKIKERARWAHEQLSPCDEFPKSWLDVSFARSGGPGGQNVNKVNTKAEVRLNLGKATTSTPSDAVLEKMPRSAVQHLTKSSPYYKASSHSLLITSTKTRSQANNLEDAMAKLKEHLVELLTQGVPGETSEEQRDRVKSLINRDKAKTRKVKERRGNVKKSRKVGKEALAY